MSRKASNIWNGNSPDISVDLKNVFWKQGLLNLNYFLENFHEGIVRVFRDEEDPEEHKKIKTQ